METLVQGELKTADFLSSLGSLLAALVSIAATTLFKLAVILSAKAVFLWGLKKATLHKSTIIHVKVRSRKPYSSHLFDSQAADIVLGGDHLEDYWEDEGGYNYNTTRDGNEPFKVQTDKGSATVRYDRRLSRGISLVTFADYHYNATNEASVNTVKGAVGLGVPLITTPSS